MAIALADLGVVVMVVVMEAITATPKSLEIGGRAVVMASPLDAAPPAAS